MSHTIKIRKYHPQDKERVLEIIERVWDKKRRNDHAFLWDWKHALDAGCQNDSHVAQVIVVDGQVLGYAGAIPAFFKVGAKTVEGGLCMDTFTDPDSRGTGMQLLKGHLEGATLLIGAAVPRAKVLWGKLEQRHHGKKDIVSPKQIRKMIRLVNPTPLLQQKGIPAPFCYFCRVVWQWYIRMRALLDRVCFNTTRRLEHIERFPEVVDRLTAEFSERFSTAIRNHRTLNWRFASCPFPYEKYLLWSADQLVGYMVYRMAWLNRRKIILLVEMLAVGRQAENYRAMLAHLQAVALEHQISDIQTLETGCSVFMKILREQGYWVKKERPWILTHLHRNMESDLSLARDQHWFFTMGDVDFEFIFYQQGQDSIVNEGGK